MKCIVISSYALHINVIFAYIIFCYNYYPGTWICIWMLLVFLCCCNISCMLICVSTLSVTGSINVCVCVCVCVCFKVVVVGGYIFGLTKIMMKDLGQDSQLVSWETNIVGPPEYEEVWTPQLWCSVKFIFQCRSNGSQDSIAHILTGLQAGQSGVQIPTGTKLCLYRTSILAVAPPSLLPGVLSLGVKWPEHEVDHSPPSSDDIQNECSCTFTPPLCLHGMVANNLTL